MNNKQIFHYKISYDSHTEEIYSHDPEDNNSTSTSYYISNDIIETKNISDFMFTNPLNLNKPYYAVYLIYSTGDSFSQQDGNSIIFIDLFNNKDNALNLIKLIEDNSKAYNDIRDLSNTEFDFSIKYFDDENNEKTLSSMPWLGYFESIDNCDIQEVFLTNPTKKNRRKFK